MCHTVLHAPKLYTLLSQADQERAAQVRAAGCACGGLLHSARYRRKPRGGPASFRGRDHQRLSFCCNRCRRRNTPRSLFYLGRRVYLGTVVMLASAMRDGLTGAALRELCSRLGVPVATLDRWRRWWNQELLATPFWKEVRGSFMPPICGSLLGGLLVRFSSSNCFERLLQGLRFVSPLSTVTEGRRP